MRRRTGLPMMSGEVVEGPRCRVGLAPTVSSRMPPTLVRQAASVVASFLRRVPWVAMTGSHARPVVITACRVPQDRRGDDGLRLGGELVGLPGGGTPLSLVALALRASWSTTRVVCWRADGSLKASRGSPALHTLIAEHLPEDWAEAEPEQVQALVKVGIETDRGPWVAALVTAGYEVFAINPMSVARTGSGTPRRGRSPMPRTPTCWLRSSGSIGPITVHSRATPRRPRRSSWSRARTRA
jgi:hypothetical protein